jgi:hypothetical protein
MGFFSGVCRPDQDFLSRLGYRPEDGFTGQERPNLKQIVDLVVNSPLPGRLIEILSDLCYAVTVHEDVGCVGRFVAQDFLLLPGSGEPVDPSSVRLV